MQNITCDTTNEERARRCTHRISDLIELRIKCSDELRVGGSGPQCSNIAGCICSNNIDYTVHRVDRLTVLRTKELLTEEQCLLDVHCVESRAFLATLCFVTIAGDHRGSCVGPANCPGVTENLGVVGDASHRNGERRRTQ